MPRVLMLAVVLAACGGGDGAGPDSDGVTLAKASPSGDDQGGAVGQALADPLRVLVSEAGAPVSGVTVTWSGAGTFDPATAQTGADGIAETSWTLPNDAGTPTAQASATGTAGSPVAFRAFAGVPTTSVNIGNNFFSPSVIVVAAGAEVEWTMGNTGAVQHNVISNGQPSFTSSGTLNGSGTTYRAAFAAPGVYQYACTFHSGMTGTVIAQ